MEDELFDENEYAESILNTLLGNSAWNYSPEIIDQMKYGNRIAEDLILKTKEKMKVIVWVDVDGKEYWRSNPEYERE